MIFYIFQTLRYHHDNHDNNYLFDYDVDFYNVNKVQRF